MTDPARLRREPGHVRAAGYARNVEDMISGLTSVAAPIRDHTGTMVAATSVAGPGFRLIGDRVDDCFAIVKGIAMAASRGLGWRMAAVSQRGNGGEHDDLGSAGALGGGFDA